MPFSTTKDIDHPDLLFFDVDLSPRNLKRRCRSGIAPKDKLESLGYTPFVKTSGKKGLHVVVPVKAAHTFEQTRVFVHKIGIALAGESSLIVSEFKDTKKPGKVFVDYLQNSPMRTMIVPYSRRPTPNATVSTPLEWREVHRGIEPSDFNLSNVAKAAK